VKWAQKDKTQSQIYK